MALDVEGIKDKGNYSWVLARKPIRFSRLYTHYIK